MSIQKTNDSFEQIQDMLKAYYPALYLTSFEYDRTKQKLRGIAKSLDRSYLFYEWNCVDGLRKEDLSNGNLTSLEDNEEPEQLLKFIATQSEKKEAEIFILEDFHDFIEERNIKILLRQLAEKLRFFKKHIIIVSSVLKLPVELEKYITVVELALPGRTDLERVLLKVAEDAKVEIDNDLKKKLVDSALGMTVMEADLAFCLAVVKNNNNFDINSPRVVALEKEQIIKKSGLLDYFHVNEELRSVGGMDFLKSWLEKRKQAYDFKAQLWKLPEPKGLLLLGVPGCGKSLTAKCIASLWNMPLLRFDIGKVFQGIVGSSEDNIRRAIATAEAVAPCVLWIDEIEKGLSGVQSSGATDGGTTSRIFSTILTWMQEKTQPVFVVATANDISLLPPELLRKGRFDEIFFVDLPNEEDRKSIFSIHLAKKNQKTENFGLDKLAKESAGFNGAEIEECVKEAMFAAYTEDPYEPKLQIMHLLNAIKDTVPLSKTMKDKIDFLRKWAKNRAKQAGKENLENIANADIVPLTKTEKELNRNFD
jgi:ATP-dependent 26S proteasome regulatory subunit